MRRRFEMSFQDPEMFQDVYYSYVLTETHRDWIICTCLSTPPSVIPLPSRAQFEKADLATSTSSTTSIESREFTKCGLLPNRLLSGSKGIAKSGARTSKQPPQHFMSNKMMRTGNRSPQLPLSTLISCVEATFKDLLVMVSTCGPSTRVYRRLIAAEAEEALKLMSATDGSSTPICFQVNRLLAGILDRCAKDVASSRVRRLRSKTQQKLLKEFYRAVKEATNLMRLCCNPESWLMTALSMVDGKETYALRFSELLWFKRVVGSSDTGEELDWQLRWEPALVEDRSNLRENLKTVIQDTSAEEYPLAWNLFRRLEPAQGTSKPPAKNGVLYLKLEGLNVQQDKPLGSGATATIYKATWRGEAFAVKEFCQSNFELAAIEASIATEVHHPNVVRVLGRVQVHEGTPGLLMELMSTSLLSYVQASNRTWSSWLKSTPFQPLVAVDMMLQIAEAMRYLHEKNIAHLDLKAGNILVNLISDSNLAREGYVNIKLVDFGCSENNVKSSTSLYKPYVGTTRYRAPEIRTGLYTRTVDMYGFALVSYQIMTGNEPFPGQRNMAEFNEKVRNGDRPKWRLFEPYPSSLKTLIEECWSGDPNTRPGFATICKRLRRIKGFLITGSYDGVEEFPMDEELPVDEESMDPAGQGDLEQDLLRPDSYFILSHNAAQRIFHLKSGWAEHPWTRTDVRSLLRTPYLNKMQCYLLVQYLRNSMDEVKEQMRSSPEAASVMTLTEFYRIVIACEKLILQCCDENWQTAAIWVMDCESTFLLRISELLWCTAVIAKTPWQGAAFTERIDEISRTLSEYAEKDRGLLKNMLEVATVGDSRNGSGGLVAYLSRRADAKGDEVVKCHPNLLSREREIIGEGAFGRVYKAIMFNESVAIKEFEKDYENMAKSEASVMAKLKHPGVVPLVGVCSDPSSEPCLIMELMSGDLRDLISSRFPFPLHVCVDIMLQIAEAMKHVHNAGWVHGDLNPTDILFKVVEDEHLSKAGFVVVKVADFGSAEESREGELSENLRMFSGGPWYMAPEVPRRGENIGTAWIRNSNVVDIYSFGITCWHIFSRELPFEGLKTVLAQRRLMTVPPLREGVRAGFRPTLPARCPRPLASLIERCWASDPNSRPDFETICLDLRHIKAMLMTGKSPSINFS